MRVYHVKRHVVTQPSDTSYRLIPLTQGKNAIVDAADFDWLSQWNWFAARYMKTENYYAHRKSGRTEVHMSRVIANCREGLEVDHINHNTLDNRRSNLRTCTRLQNLANTRHINSTGFRGVVKQSSIGRRKIWQAKIKIHGFHKTIGYFRTAEEAAKAHDHVARKVHGKFATLNFTDQ